MLDERRNEKIGEILYFCSFIPLVAILILDTTTFPFVDNKIYNIISYLVMVLACVLSIVKCLLFDKDRSLRTRVLVSLSCILIAFQGTIIVNNFNLFFMSVVCFAAHKINALKILKVYLAVSAFIVILSTLLAKCGVILNLVYYEHGMYRYGLGNIYCTDYGARFFFLVLITLCVFRQSIKIIHIIGIFLVSVLVFTQTCARLDCGCILLSLILFTIDMYINKKGKTDIKRLWESVCQKTAIISMPVAAIIMFFLSLFYSPASPVMCFLNNVLNGRLYFGHNGFSEFGITLFGQDVVFYGIPGAHDDVYNFIDCSYLNTLFRFGLIVTLAVIIAYVFMARKYRKNTFILLAICLVSLNCMIAHHIIELAYNPLLILLFADCSDKLVVPVADGTP